MSAEMASIEVKSAGGGEHAGPAKRDKEEEEEIRRQQLMIIGGAKSVALSLQHWHVADSLSFS